MTQQPVTSDLRLWPRLLHAAHQVDEQLHTTFQDLRTAGAALEVSADGGLKLGAGTMGEAAYRQVRTEQFQPKEARMKSILQRARTLPHPWLQAVQEAAADLDKRVRLGHNRFTTHVELASYDEAMVIGPALLERRVAATYVNQALYYAGWPAYGDRAMEHARQMVLLVQTLLGVQATFRASGIAWPIQTPDGRIWICDYLPDAPDQVEVDKQTITRPPEEPLLDDYGLSEILAPLDQGARQEVG